MYIHSFSYSWLASGIMGLRNVCALYMKKYVFFLLTRTSFSTYICNVGEHNVVSPLSMCEDFDVSFLLVCGE